MCVFHDQMCNQREREAETMEKSENEREMESGPETGKIGAI